MLECATPNHLKEIMAWFPDRHSCQVWGGPQFRFPFTESSFREDTRIDVLSSYVLTGSGHHLLGFGQYYSRVGRCHLGRLAVSPEHRGQGFGQELIRGLVGLARQDLTFQECSLFVAADNLPAIRLYEKLGFVRTEYPEKDPEVLVFEYMVAPALEFDAERIYEESAHEAHHVHRE